MCMPVCVCICICVCLLPVIDVDDPFKVANRTEPKQKEPKTKWTSQLTSERGKKQQKEKKGRGE